MHEQRALGRGLRCEVEVPERLVLGKGGVADPLARSRGIAREDLRLEQGLEELLVGPPLGSGVASHLPGEMRRA